MKHELDVSRRGFLQAGLSGAGLSGLGIGLAGTAAMAGAVESDSAGSGSSTRHIADHSMLNDHKTYVKLLGTTATDDVYIWFEGILWGVVTGSEAAPLCTFQGLARHRWTAKPDGTFVQKSFDVGFFGDLETGLPASKLTNPITGETVRPYHYKYGGSQKLYTTDGQGYVGSDGNAETKPYNHNWKHAGHQVWLTEQATGQIKSILQPDDWPRESPGEMSYYAGETSYTSTFGALTDAATHQADFSLFWSSFAPWEPWLLMDGLQGSVMWRGVGVKLRSVDDVSPAIFDHVMAVQPNYFDASDPWDGVKSNFARFQRDRTPAKPRVD